MESQILKSLSDINVVMLLASAMRLEEDFRANRIREFDTSDYAYSDEVLGFAIANQIAGT